VADPEISTVVTLGERGGGRKTDCVGGREAK